MIKNKFEELKHSAELPSPSGVGLAILRLTQNPSHSLDELTRCVRVDPALTGLLLARANARVKDGEHASTVAQAVARLGVSQVRTIALGFKLVSVQRSDASATFDYERYWSRALACAMGARAIAASTRSFDPSEAFTCGLLSQVGMLALVSVHGEAYAGVLSRSAGQPLRALLDAEHRAFQIDHIEVTTALMGEWGLSRAFTGAVAMWADPSAGPCDDPNQRTLAWTLDVAMRIAELLIADHPHESDEHVAAWAPLCAAARTLGIDEPGLVRTCASIAREWRECGELFRIPTAANAGFTTPDDLVDEVVAALATSDLAESASTEHAAAARDEQAARGRGSIHVLVVDDDARLVRLVALHLQRAGYHVSTAENGKIGLHMALKEQPDIVVTDWTMPELSGIEMCKALRRVQSGHRAYVLLLTAREEEDRIVDAFSAGVDDYVTKPFNARILLARVQAGQRLIELQRQVEADKIVRLKQVSEMGLLTRRLRAAALTDILTELPNRRYAAQRLHQEWQASLRLARPLSLVMIDIDYFKRINDEFGHGVGDKVLQSTADVLRRRTRRGDIVCRWGGEEFLVINVNSDIAGARKCAERLRAAVEQNEIACEGFQGHVTVSLGVAERADAVRDFDALIKLADNAVYEAKSAGRNTIRHGIPGSLSESA